MEEPGGLLSMESHRVRHDWSDLACLHYIYNIIIVRVICMMHREHYWCYSSTQHAPQAFSPFWSLFHGNFPERFSLVTYWKYPFVPQSYLLLLILSIRSLTLCFTWVVTVAYNSISLLVYKPTYYVLFTKVSAFHGKDLYLVTVYLCSQSCSQ